MKYKIVASVIILLIVVMALAMKGCGSSTPQYDENGVPIENVQQ